MRLYIELSTHVICRTDHLLGIESSYNARLCEGKFSALLPMRIHHCIIAHRAVAW